MTKTKEHNYISQENILNIVHRCKNTHIYIFPSYLSFSPSDLHTPPFFQSTRREIGSETTDNLSEDNPMKNAYRASAHALILTHPYIFASFKSIMYFIRCEDVFSLPNAFTTNKRNFKAEQRCRDGVMNEFVSWCRHLLVSFLFHALTSLHPPSFYRNDFSTCIIYKLGVNNFVPCRELVPIWEEYKCPLLRGHPYFTGPISLSTGCLHSQ